MTIINFIVALLETLLLAIPVTFIIIWWAFVLSGNLDKLEQWLDRKRKNHAPPDD